MKWSKEIPLALGNREDVEIWLRSDNKNVQKFKMNVSLGKKTDLLRLKKNIVGKIKKNIKYYQQSREKLYSQSNMEYVDKCPVCGRVSSNSVKKLNVYKAQYVQCPVCTHIYVLYRPSKKSIYNFYLNDNNYAATYTDKKSAELRLNSIAVPWVDWMVKVYRKAHKRMPKNVLDIGSGAGHFVEACKRRGLKAEGIEISSSSRRFAKDIWGLDLDDRDFLKVADEYKHYDIVTFWGVLEHTSDPAGMLKKTYDILSAKKNSMLVSKLPRWYSLSTAVQSLSTDTVIRHLDPMGHIMVFTDASAAELYYQNKFVPFAAWYYGMDIYETLTQVGNKIKDYELLTKTGVLQVELQQYVDEARFSDGLTIAGIPMRRQRV